MTDLEDIFDRLGLGSYVERFVGEGFDTWETVLDITESDLEALNVKLGHRRKLQKEIASAKGISIEQVIAAGVVRNQAGDDGHAAASDVKSSAGPSDSKAPASGPIKRKYRRHPKPDENAPERPPSAYVIFSNKIREELRPHKLSFTEIAKRVGERWQELRREQKEQYESQASSAKEVYNAELAKYKRTPQYREYMQYLNDFKARNSSHAAEGKRPKLETEFSNASSGSGASVNLYKESSNPEHFRKDSLSQSGCSPTNSSVNSPTAPISRFGTSSLESQHSYPSTPISNYPKQSSAAQNVQGQRSSELSKSQPLPRIVPFESREAAVPHRIPPIGDSATSYSSNPRRSGTNSPASLMRHETSKSSTSSNLSGGSSIPSGAFGTPITPAEDYRNRALPIPSSLLTKLPPTGQSLVDLSRPTANSPTGPKPTAEYGSAPPTHPGYSQAFNHLSIAGENQGDRASRSLSAHGDLSMESAPSHHSMHSHHAFSAHPPPLPRKEPQPQSSRDTGGQDSASRLDSLSVLALAGRMMDRERQENDSIEK